MISRISAFTILKRSCVHEDLRCVELAAGGGTFLVEFQSFSVDLLFPVRVFCCDVFSFVF